MENTVQSLVACKNHQTLILFLDHILKLENEKIYKVMGKYFQEIVAI